MTGDWVLLLAVALAALLGTGACAVAQQSPSAWPDDPIAALRAMPVEPKPEKGRVVRVVDADGKPVADALVVFEPVIERPPRRSWREITQRYCGDEPKCEAALVLDGARYAVATMAPPGCRWVWQAG